MGYELGKKISKLGFNTLTSDYLIIIKNEKDIRIAQELEDHLIESDISEKNIASIWRLTAESKADLAKSLGLKINSVPKTNISESEYIAPVDAVWFKVMLEAVLDLAIFLKTPSTHPIITDIKADSGAVNITILIDTPANVLENSDLVLTRYSEKISRNTRLILSSGLEAFIARSIANQLDILLTIEKNPDSGSLTFLISIKKHPTEIKT